MLYNIVADVRIKLNIKFNLEYINTHQPKHPSSEIEMNTVTS